MDYNIFITPRSGDCFKTLNIPTGYEPDKLYL